VPAYGQLLIIVAALVVFWLVVMAPARRQQKGVAHLQQELQVGDKVVISAGIFGTIVGIDGSRVTLEVAPGVVLTVARQVVVRRQDADAPTEEPADAATPEPAGELPDQAREPGAGTQD
jgi:preprotein translocase subunit YajC